MLSEAKAGMLFQWKALEGATAGTARVLAVRTDDDEGLASEVEQYAALWLEAKAETGTLQGSTLTFMLGTDNRTYLSGREVDLKLI